MKITIQIDIPTSSMFRSIAKILGVPLSEVLENELVLRVEDIGSNGGLISGTELENYFTDMEFTSRKKAEGLGGRLEAFATEESLTKGTGMIATRAVATEEGRWCLKIHRLAPTKEGNRWTEETVFNDGNEGEGWKEEL